MILRLVLNSNIDDDDDISSFFISGLNVAYAKLFAIDIIAIIIIYKPDHALLPEPRLPRRGTGQSARNGPR